MRALVYLDHHDSSLQPDCLGLLTHVARMPDAEAYALIVGSDVRDLSLQVGPFGAKAVLVADDPVLADDLPQPRVDLIAQVVRDREFDTVLFSQSVLAADVAAGLAVRLGAGLNWDLFDLKLLQDRLIGKRLALSDSIVVEVGWRSAVRVGLFRPATFEPSRDWSEAPTEDIRVDTGSSTGDVRVVDRPNDTSADDLRIEDAKIIVAGGRGAGPDGPSLLGELAEALGGSVGATRPVVDAGWYPPSAEIGQTGHKVAPDLYVACGISGAVQHKVGMQTSKVIVAINKDPHAPIFAFCDFGVVGDVESVVPRLTALLRAG